MYLFFKLDFNMLDKRTFLEVILILNWNPTLIIIIIKKKTNKQASMWEDSFFVTLVNVYSTTKNKRIGRRRWRNYALLTKANKKKNHHLI